jgi:acetyl-CoA C-acetyltransferase
VTSSSPCLIGWAQVSRSSAEPLDAWGEALRATDVPLRAIDSLDVLYCQSWPYDDPAGRLAELVGATPARAAYSGIGGTTPLQLVIAAAQRIAAGESEVCAVVGGEALAQVRALKKAGERPAWSYRHPEKPPFPFEAPFHDAEVAHQLFQAYSTFAMRDIARRGHLGLGVAEHRQLIGDLFAPMSEVAATNPHAWFPHAWSGAEVAEPAADNRMVAFPYTKRLVAVMDVDLAAAVVVASSDAADRLRVPEEDRVHLRGWAAATDPVYVAEHDELWRSPAMARALHGALESAGSALDGIRYADLYSCFPSSVLFALDALGIGVDDALAPFTVTGGLPYAGGAGSGYLLSSMAAMADRLRSDPGSTGLVSGVGMHLTKHVAAVLSTEPGEPGPPPEDQGPAVRRPIVGIRHGPATVAAYTVHHGRDGAPTDAVLVCDVEGAVDGARCYAAARQPDLLAALEAEEWVGRRVLLGDGGGGVNLVVSER